MRINVKKITIPKLIKLVRRLLKKINYLYQERIFKFYPLQLLNEVQNRALQINGVNEFHIESIRLSNTEVSGRGLPRYQEEIISNGHFISICPTCGKNIYSEKSLPVFVHGFDLPIFYKFSCCYEFYLISAKSPARILGIYIPQKNVIISLENYIDYPHNLNYYGLKTFLIWIRELEGLKRVYSVQAQPQKARKGKLLVLTGFLDNFGHHLPDEIGGLSQLSLSELSGLEILIGPNDWFNLKNIFNEVEQYDESLKSNSPDLIGRVFSYIEKSGAFATRITSNLPLSNAICEKIINISKKQLNKEKSNLLLEIQGTPIVWITLRSHCRCWDGQVDGLSKVINKLYLCFPNIAIVFDGLHRETNSYELIKSNIHPQVKVFSVLGFSLYESIPFVVKCNLFIAPLGAGVALTSIPNIPGILHTHSEWAKQEFIIPSPRENGVNCIVIGGEITSGKDVFDFNYEISTQKLFENAMKVLESLGFHSNTGLEG